ncbi:MAG: VOC family protein [Eubacteriales bacterium]|nr:VOC family protein [Eubacteriales bacterium]
MPGTIHHVALDVPNFDWYCRFFQEVFEMTPERKKGEAPRRQIWFAEGIQLNEVATQGEHGGMYSHLGIASDDWDTVIARARAMGCRQYEEKKHWFDTPDGYAIELKKPRE